MTPAEMDTYTFTASAGDKVLVRMSKSSGTLWPGITVYSPDGTKLCETYGSSTAKIASCTLTSTGTYSILAYDGYYGTRTGDYSLYLQRNNPGIPVPITFGVPQEIEVTSDLPAWFQIEVLSNTANLFLTLQKYGSWSGELKLYSGTQVLVSTSGYSDQILQWPSPTPGTYLVEVSGSGSGRLTAYTALPDLPMGQWVVGSILHQWGSAWYQFTVPPGQSSIFINVETLGLWSQLKVYSGTFGSTPYWSASGYTMTLGIPSPAPGIYYAQLSDSAWVEGSNQVRDHLIRAGATPVEPPPCTAPVITNFTPDKGGTAGPVTVNINGQCLDAQSTVYLARNGYTNVTATLIAGADDRRRLTATFSLSGAEPGNWNLVVTNQTAQSVTASTPFTVESGGENNLWLRLSGRGQLRVGRWQTYIVTIGNSGAIDVPAANVYLWFPSSASAKLYRDPCCSITSDPALLPPDYDLATAGFSIFVRNIPAGSQQEFTLELNVPQGTEAFDIIGVAEPLLSTDNFSSSLTGQNRDYIPTDNAPTETLTLEIWQGINTNGLHPKPVEHSVFSFSDGQSFEACFDNAYKCTGHWINTNDLHQNYKKDGLSLVQGSVEISTGEIQLLRQELDGLTITKMGKWDYSDLDFKGIWDRKAGNCRGALEGSSEKAGIHGGIGFTQVEDVSQYDVITEWAGAFGIQPWQLMVFYFKNLPKKDLHILYGTYEGKPGFSFPVSPITSVSPEDKYGPSGYDAPGTLTGELRHWVHADQSLDYRIDFWNKSDAPAATVDVIITDTLDPNLDWSTFKFTEIGFLDWKVPLEPGQYFNVDIPNVTIDLSPYYPGQPTVTMTVNVEGTFDPTSGTIRWEFHALDPVTRQPPENPYAGFLPPITDSGWEIGWVNFSALPKPGLASGTVISNQSFVKFDVDVFKPAPKQGPFINTLDAAPPTSAVQSPTGTQRCASFPVSWSGGDDMNGSGLRSFDVYVDNLGDTSPAYLWQANTTTHSAMFTGVPGQRYGFYTRARDNVGNVEAIPEPFRYDVEATAGMYCVYLPLVLKNNP
jgi:hypothetical protein